MQSQSIPQTVERPEEVVASGWECPSCERVSWVSFPICLQCASTDVKPVTHRCLAVEVMPGVPFAIEVLAWDEDGEASITRAVRFPTAEVGDTDGLTLKALIDGSDFNQAVSLGAFMEGMRS